MSTNNNVRLIGNLTDNPTAFTWGENKTGAKYTIAVNEGTGDNKKTTFLDIVNFYGNNDLKFLTKGQKVIIDGAIDIQDYTTQNGEKRKSFKIKADKVTYLTKAVTQAKDTQAEMQAE